MSKRQFLGLTVIILLLYWGIRLTHLLSLPLFIDETLHGERAISVWAGSPLWFGVNGKLFGSWWVALFYPFPVTPWLLRASILLLTPLSVASIMALTRRFYGALPAIYAGVLLVFAPMLFFFDRMSLADTTLHPMLSLFVLALFVLLDSPHFRWRIAVMGGIALALSVLAKATALTILPLPLLAVWVLPRGWPVKLRLQALLWLLGTALLIWLPLLVLMRLRNLNYMSVPIGQHSAGAGELLQIDRIIANMQFLLDGLVVYHGGLTLLVAAIAAVAAMLARPRVGFMLALAVAAPATGIIVAGDSSVSMRYWLGLMPLVLALVAGGLHTLGQRLVGPRLASWLVFLLISVWVVFSGISFIHTAYHEPPALRLPAKDRLEYLEADSAGTMLPELADFLVAEEERLGEIAVTAAISQCYGLSLYLPVGSDIALDCPHIYSPEGRGAALDSHVAALAGEHAHYYVIFEHQGMVPVTDITTVSLEPVAEFPRPGGLVTITVYQPIT